MNTVWLRINTVAMLLVLFALLTLIGLLATRAEGGPIDPFGPPGPTYHSLGVVPPSWTLALPADDTGDPCNSRRFACVLGGEAVLDNETGLVWQRDPETSAVTWYAAASNCRVAATGGKYGWRLPATHELASLLDTSADFLPDGHPFGGQAAVTGEWWSNSAPLLIAAGSSPPHPDILFSEVVVNPAVPAIDTRLTLNNAWCVRGTGNAQSW